ncbi:MAG: T9SS type A sorting domain-containing protein [Flavobacteriales bacterium]|nr:T9SS type A sorting domain-containing protein [Flavobacteriales bacterium]
MKTLLLSIVTLSFSAVLTAQGCDGIIISEYVEGWSNNKAIEVYNASPNPIDMAPYGLVRFANQDQNPSNAVDLQGTLMPYDTYVVVLDKRDSTGTGFDAPVWDELQLVTDTFANPDYNDGAECMYFNGNDAVMLLDVQQAGLVVYDLFGKVGDSDFPDGWGPYLNSMNEPVFMSANHTLIRKQNVTLGVATNPVLFDLTAEWDTLPANTFENLGSHSCICDPSVGLEEINSNAAIELFPNPSENGYFEVSSEGLISEVVIYAITGEKVFEKDPSDLNSNYRIETTDWKRGIYLVNVRTNENVVSTKRLIIK